MNTTPAIAAAAQSALLSWFAAHGRSLPWRGAANPYAVLVSEVMLQQTQVERVIPVYEAFLRRFPTFRDLADAPTAEVIRAWAGMGYNRRAVNLQRAAREVVAHHGGTLPETAAELRALPGVGAYTAAALACFALGQQAAVVDTNVRRVLSRMLYWPMTPTERAVAEAAERALPAGRAWAWNQALMDLGATVCTARRPACSVCPVRADCRAAGALDAGYPGAVAEAQAPYGKRPAPFKGSSRYYRGRVIAALRALPPGNAATLDELGAALQRDAAPVDAASLRTLLAALARDGLIALRPRADAPDAALRVSLP